MTTKAPYRDSAPTPITLTEPTPPPADEATRSVPAAKAPPSPKTIDLYTAPIDVKTPEDIDRLKSLVRQAVDRGIAFGHEHGYERGVKDGIEWAFAEGVKVGLVEGSTATPGQVIEAFLSSGRARPATPTTTTKVVERDDAGRISRIVETAK